MSTFQQPRTCSLGVATMLLLEAFAQNAQAVVPLDTSQYVVLMPPEDHDLFREKVTPIGTTPEMIAKAETILRAFQMRLQHDDGTLRDSLIAQGDRYGSTAPRFGMVDLDRSFRQYTSGRTSLRSVLLYVNGIPNDREEFPERTNRWVFVRDGGSRYFQALIDLNTGTIIRLWVNGFG